MSLDTRTDSKTNREPLVGIVVVNWHNRTATLRCLAALARLDYPRWRLFFIDNGCEDFSDTEIEQLAPGGRYSRTADNLGFTGGSNLGMHAALADGADYVWFLNNDAEPEPDALRALVDVARTDSSVAVVGAKILQRANPARIDSIALHVSLRTGRVLLVGHGQTDLGQYDSWREPVAVTGCAMLVGSDTCRELEGFDDAFFAYLEDADLCLRARAAGRRIAIAPRARVLHDRRMASAGRQSLSSLYYTSRNHLMLMRRHARGPVIARTLRDCCVIGLNLAFASKTARMEGLRQAWRGVRDFRRRIVGACPAREE